MVLISEQAKVFKGVLEMASKPCSVSGEQGSTDSPKQCISQEELPHLSDSFGSYPTLFQGHYLPTSATMFVTMPCQYTFYAAMPHDECFQMDVSEYLSSHQSLTFTEDFSAGQEAAFAVPCDTEFQPIAKAVGSPYPGEEGLEVTWEHLSLRDRSTCRLQCPAHSNAGLDSWTFDFPAELCGRLIGKKGRNLQKVMHETDTMLKIYEQKCNEKRKVLRICGTSAQITQAASLIEKLFVQRSRCEEWTVSRVLPLVHQEEPAIVAKQVELPIDVEVNVKLTSVINAGHFYLTLSKSTVVESKSTFERDMNAFYNSGHIPKLSSPPPVGTYCVGTVGSKWVRVQVISSFFMAKKVEALLLDYGHFVLLSFSSLRKMRYVLSNLHAISILVLFLLNCGWDVSCAHHEKKAAVGSFFCQAECL